MSTLHGYRLKQYSLAFDDSTVPIEDFADGFALAGATMPQPAVAADRPGVGFAIAHHGAAGPPAG